MATGPMGPTASAGRNPEPPALPLRARLRLRFQEKSRGPEGQPGLQMLSKEPPSGAWQAYDMSGTAHLFATPCITDEETEAWRGSKLAGFTSGWGHGARAACARDPMLGHIPLLRLGVSQDPLMKTLVCLSVRASVLQVMAPSLGILDTGMEQA